MKFQKLLMILAICAIVLSACAPGQATVESPTATAQPDEPVASTPGNPEPETPSYEPQPGDKNMTRSKVYIEGAEVLVLESEPPQVMLHVAGNLPNPCHNLRIQVNPPDAKNNILVDVYAVVDPTKNCIEVIKPFDASVRLDVGLAKGAYSVYVNGEPIGAMDVK